MRYLQVDKGEAVWFIRPEIMDLWTDKPLISEGFATCYPLISVKPFTTKAQAIHVSEDPWFRTPWDALKKRIDQWQAEGDSLLLLTVPRSAIGQYEIKQFDQKFKGRFVHIPVDLNSRFGIVYDTKNAILLAQFTDAKLLRIYQGFSK